MKRDNSSKAQQTKTIPTPTVHQRLAALERETDALGLTDRLAQAMRRISFLEEDVAAMQQRGQRIRKGGR